MCALSSYGPHGKFGDHAKACTNCRLICIVSDSSLLFFKYGLKLWRTDNSIRKWGGGVIPYTGDTGMCGPKAYGFLGVLVINRVSILASNRLWFLHSSLE